jgi:hypothetical protein
MKALIRDRYGPPETLEVRDIERPAPKEREVLVRVHAASVNDWDWQMLRPMLPLGSKTPRIRILGSDVAGRVAALGRGVQRFTVGDEVYGDLSRFGSSGGWGGFAEYVCAPEAALIRKSPRMTFEQAAALPQAGQLAVQGLFAAGPLNSGPSFSFGWRLARCRFLTWPLIHQCRSPLRKRTPERRHHLARLVGSTAPGYCRFDRPPQTRLTPICANGSRSCPSSNPKTPIRQSTPCETNHRRSRCGMTLPTLTPV